MSKLAVDTVQQGVVQDADHLLRGDTSAGTALKVCPTTHEGSTRRFNGIV